MLSKHKRENLCLFVSWLGKTFPESVAKHSFLSNQYKDLRRLYFVGKYCVLSQIHSYVLLSDIILDLFTFKLKWTDRFQHQQSKDYLSSLNSKKINEPFEKDLNSEEYSDTTFILLNLWSDGFYANFVKKSKCMDLYINTNYCLC